MDKPKKEKNNGINYFLNCYTPICTSKKGKEAASQYKIPPFADASCRREPDLEHKRPSITATCRCGQFVPRLEKGDMVVYVTKKGKYESRIHGWRLIAILEVIEKFENHKQAKKWYEDNNYSLPSNCLVPGNPPLPEKETGQIYGKKSWPFATSYEATESQYQARVKKVPVFIVTKPLAKELNNPITLTEKDMLKTFGRIPGMQNPPKITEKQFNELSKIIKTQK